MRTVLRQRRSIAGIAKSIRRHTHTCGHVRQYAAPLPALLPCVRKHSGQRGLRYSVCANDAGKTRRLGCTAPRLTPFWRCRLPAADAWRAASTSATRFAKNCAFIPTAPHIPFQVITAISAELLRQLFKNNIVAFFQIIEIGRSICVQQDQQFQKSAHHAHQSGACAVSAFVVTRNK